MSRIFAKLNYYFIASLLLILTLKFILYPSLTSHAEVWAEAGINFLPHALYDNYWQNLWATDSGYLPWFQRLIVVLIVKVFGSLSFYASATQMAAIGFIALFSSSINIRAFRQIFPSDFLRFMLGVAIAFIPDYEVQTLINFSYFGITPVVLFLFIDKEKIKNVPFWIISLFLLLVMISKPHYIALTPVLLVLGWIAYTQKRYRSLSFYLLGLVGFIMQIISLKLHPSIWDKSISSTKVIGEIIYVSFSMYKHVFLNDYIFGSLPGFLIYIFALGVIFYAFINEGLQKKNRSSLYFFISCNVIAILAIIMTITSVKEIFPPQMPFFSVPNDRHFIFVNILILLAGAVILQTLIKNRKILFGVVALIISTSSAVGYFYNKEAIAVSKRAAIVKIERNMFDPYNIPQRSYSQWSIYHTLIYKDQYCIPLNPFPFLLTKNCKYLNTYKENTIEKNKKSNISLLPFKNSSRWNIQAVILVNNRNTQFQKLSLVAYDKEGNKVNSAVQLTPDGTYDYIYFLFKSPVKNIASVEFTQNGKPFPVVPAILLLGQ